MTTQQVIQTMCIAYETPAAQRKLIQKWVSQGASEEEATTVVAVLMRRC